MAYTNRHRYPSAGPNVLIVSPLVPQPLRRAFEKSIMNPLSRLRGPSEELDRLGAIQHNAAIDRPLLASGCYSSFSWVPTQDLSRGLSEHLGSEVLCLSGSTTPPLFLRFARVMASISNITTEGIPCIFPGSCGRVIIEHP